MPSDELIKFRGYINSCVYPRQMSLLGVGDNTYGIIRVELDELLEGKPSVDEWELFGTSLTVTGEFDEPISTGCAYTFLVKEVEHPKYGIQYNLLYCSKLVDLTKTNGQVEFLSSFLTDLQVKELYNTYENPLEIIEKHDSEGLQKVKGIGPYIARCIIERYEKNKDLSVVYAELNKYGFTPKFIQKLVRFCKTPQKAIDLVKNHPYSLIEMDGIGFKTCDQIALNGGIAPKSVERIEAFILYYLDAQAKEEGNSYITSSELTMGIYNYFGGKENILDIYEDNTNNISNAIQNLIDRDLIVLEDNAVKSNRRIYLKSVYNLEKEIAKHLKRLLGADNKFLNFGWEERIDILERKQGFCFDETQLNGIKLGMEQQVCFITGPAGSGKSSLVAGILAGLSQYTFAQTALAGKAAARLQEVTGEEGKTIHRLLGYTPFEGFSFNEDNPLPYDIIILDELSLVGGEIFLSLLKAIPTGSKLLMLGDNAQLPAIGMLNLATDMLESEVIPTVKLETIHRQALESGIISSALSIRNQKPLFANNEEGILPFGTKNDMIFDVTKDNETTLERTLTWFKKGFDSTIVGRDINKIQILSPVKERGNASVMDLNLAVQRFCIPEGAESVLHKKYKDKDYYIYIGDKVKCTKNNYRDCFDIDGNPTFVFNGWFGNIVDYDKTMGTIGVNFPLSDGIVYMPTNVAFDILQLGYASTVHASQGSDWPIVIGAIDYSTPPQMLNSALVYTLVTRSKKLGILVGQTPAINQAIVTDCISYKKTFLQELLREV